MSITEFGAVGDGATDCSDAIEAAFASGARVMAPSGTFVVKRKLAIPSSCVFVGAGRRNTVIRSNVVGDSLFHVPGATTAYIYLADMTLEGNRLTGASGNGHALNFIDPGIDRGSHTPQSCVVERLEIRRFKGFDRLYNGALVEACGIIQCDGLQNVFRDVNILDCGHGFYFYRAQNTKLQNSSVVRVMKAALIVHDCENFIADGCAFMHAADGVPSTGYPVPFGSAIVVSYDNENFVLRGSKLKNTNGGVTLRSILSSGDLIQGNWLRADSLTDNVHKGIYVDQSSGIRIRDNVFSPAHTGFTARKYQQVEIAGTQPGEPISASVTGNTFGDVSGMNIEYNIKITGASSRHAIGPITITENQFGFRSRRAAESVVDADILIEQCTLTASEIRKNLHHAPKNVTRKVAVKRSGSASLADSVVGPSSFQANGGSIGAAYEDVDKRN